MIELYYWPTPNGWKVSILLEELAIEYKTIPVEINKGDQFKPEFLAISPNAKMPAIIDHSTDPSTTVFESGAILYYLAEKHQRFIPDNPIGKKEALEWLFWQTGNQGPMGGQLSHFVNYAPEGEDYSRARYLGEYQRNLAVLERRLADHEYLLGDHYSIADIIAFPWVLIAKPLSASLDDFPKVSAWRSKIKARPAVRRGVDLLKDQQNRGQHNAQNNKLLFNQGADHLIKKD